MSMNYEEFCFVISVGTRTLRAFKLMETGVVCISHLKAVIRKLC